MGMSIKLHNLIQKKKGTTNPTAFKKATVKKKQEAGLVEKEVLKRI